MDLLGDLGMNDQLTSVRSENVMLQQRVKDLAAQVKILTVENETLKAEVELYRAEMALPSFSKMALGGSPMDEEDSGAAGDDFVRAGNGVYPQHNALTLNQLHTGNHLTCALSPDDVILASGGADSVLRLLPWGLAEGKGANVDVNEMAASVKCLAPVIAVAFSSVLKQVLAVGCMDGSVSMVQYQHNNNSGHRNKLDTTMVTLPKKHIKYVRHVVWSPTEPLLATTSADGCIYIYKVERKTQLTSMYDDDDDSETILLEATLLESLHLSGAVEACCFSNQYLICYVRGTPHLTYFDTENDYKQSKKNLNQSEGGAITDHVSFAILDLRPSHDCKYLAAATDTSRNIILDLESGKILKNLYGHANDGYSQPKISWSLNSQYVLGNTQDDSVICVWDIASAQIVRRLAGHSSPIRDLCTGRTMECLITTAFDKSARLWFSE